MVSAHSADQQWRAQSKVLIYCGIDQWKQTILTWSVGAGERGGRFFIKEEEHPVMTAVLVYRSSLVKNRWAEEVLEIARSALMMGF